MADKVPDTKEAPDKSDKKEVEGYKGPGKFTAAVGRGYVEYILGSLAGMGIVVLVSANARKGLSALGKLYGAMFTGRNIREASKISEEALKGVGTVAIASVVGAVAGGAHGAYAGVKNVKAATKQVDDLNKQVADLSEQLDKQNKFTDKITAEREVASKAEDVPARK